MIDSKIILRPAQRGDASIVAQVIAMAIGDETALCSYCGRAYLAVLTEIARTKATQYSWQHALIAECEGKAVGAVIGYDGAQLATLRAGTLSIIERLTGRVPTVVDETQADEYYLDSLAVLPAYRGKGIASMLIQAFCVRAFEQNAARVGLLVDVENPKAEQLYASLGFRRVDERPFFGHRMWHMQRICDWSIRERVERSTTITEFQRRLYLELLTIPAGETISYGELARRLGCRSAQAVGQALRRNPFAPYVPCHRVVAADGTLGGYHGARQGEKIEQKRQLLAKEQRENKHGD